MTGLVQQHWSSVPRTFFGRGMRARAPAGGRCDRRFPEQRASRVWSSIAFRFGKRFALYRLVARGTSPGSLFGGRAIQPPDRPQVPCTASHETMRTILRASPAEAVTSTETDSVRKTSTASAPHAESQSLRRSRLTDVLRSPDGAQVRRPSNDAASRPHSVRPIHDATPPLPVVRRIRI